jgi:hypothetical protein
MMQPKYDILQEKEHAVQQTSQAVTQVLEECLSPLLIVLDALLDKRLVRTWCSVVWPSFVSGIPNEDSC